MNWNREPGTGRLKSEIRNPKSEILLPAFTLVELLVVISIIGILLAIALSVGSKLLTSGNKENTIATMKIVMNAVDAFYEEYQQWPDDGALGSEKTRDCRDMTNDLWGLDSDIPKSREKLNELPGKAIGNKVDLGTSIEFDLLDGFEEEMRYTPNGGLGGRPVLISAGADGMFGYVKDNSGGSGIYLNGDAGTPQAERDKWAEDDIYSDKLK